MLFWFVATDWVPEQDRFSEVYNLWVDPAYRSIGLAKQLKLRMESEAHLRGIRVICTHAEKRNTRAFELN